MTVDATSVAAPRLGLDPTTVPRLLSSQQRLGHRAHVAHYGPLPQALHGRAPSAVLLPWIAESGLSGRGGAAFPTARKLGTAAAARGRTLVVVNAMEGEPASAKDRVLLQLAPHLVLDGALSVAEALGSSSVALCVAAPPPDHPDRASFDAAARSLESAVAERHGGRTRLRVHRPPHRYVSGESTALARWLQGGPALPETRRQPLALRGVDDRPTALANAETFAHIGLVARFGPAWFRSVGTAQDPGTVLVTASGAVTRPVVTEVAFGDTLASVVGAAGGVTEEVQAVLVGGYGGTWVSAGEAATARLATRPSVGTLPVGPGIVCVLPVSACGLAETARIASYMAAEGAGQCGPCIHGLPALAGALDRLVLARTPGDADLAVKQLVRWCGQITGRGACNHPSGVVRLVRSALAVFADDVEVHRNNGHCGRVERPSVIVDPGTRR